MLITQWYVSSAYKKWSKVPNRLRITGLEAVERLIRAAGLYDIHIERVGGKRGRVVQRENGTWSIDWAIGVGGGEVKPKGRLGRVFRLGKS